MEQPVTPRSYPTSIWILLGLLIVLLLGCGGMISMLYLQGEDNALDAVKDGRRIRILVKSGKVEGNISQSEQTGLTRDEYRAQRLQQLTGSTKEKQLTPAMPSGESTIERQTPVKPSVPNVTAVKRDITYPLKNAPTPALLETLPNGLTLPARNADNTVAPWEHYSKPYNSDGSPRLLALVVTDVGINTQQTQQFLSLDERITLAFSPYAPDLREQVNAARMSGFESWLMLPLQHNNYPIHDYGPLTLLKEEEPADNLQRVQTMLSSSDGIVGLLGTFDERFSAGKQMGIVFDELHKRGILLGLHTKDFNPKLHSYMVQHLHSHINARTVPASTKQLFRDIESYVHSKGNIAVTLSAMPSVLNALDDWIATLPANNIRLVPFSALAKEQQATYQPPATAQDAP